MDLTTVARVKLAFEKTTSADDSALGQLVTEVSDAAERVMARHAKTEARTVYKNVEAGQTVWQLKGFGDPASAVASVYHDIDRAWAAASLVDPSDYSYDPETGLLYLDRTLEEGKRVLKVTYTGGMADTTANFIARYLAIAQAVEQQVVHFWQTRGHLGLQSVSFQGGSINQSEAGSKWLPWVLDVLNRHRLHAV